MRRKRMLGILGMGGHEEFDLDAIVSSDASPETRSQLSQAYLLLHQLSIEERICWTLRYVDGHKLQDVAVLSHCSLATAKRRIATAHEFLQARLMSGESQ
jgi:DNA-directed RNA polymerase specialized sigma24 family protein